jgi:hypothetical protein
MEVRQIYKVHREMIMKDMVLNLTIENLHTMGTESTYSLLAVNSRTPSTTMVNSFSLEALTSLKHGKERMAQTGAPLPLVHLRARAQVSVTSAPLRRRRVTATTSHSNTSLIKLAAPVRLSSSPELTHRGFKTPSRCLVINL